MNIRKIVGVTVLGIGAFVAGPASAALIVDGAGGLTLDNDPTAIYQQTAASPCVIGGNNCLNGDFEYTLAGPGGNGTLDNETSPLYSVEEILAVTGTNSFIMGLDYNQMVDPQTLYFFEVRYYDGLTLIGSQSFSIETVLQTNNNGVGFSDFLLTGFVIPELATHMEFQAEWYNNDGADRYFLIGVDGIQVPEPGTLGLLGLGLLAAGFSRRVAMRKHAA